MSFEHLGRRYEIYLQSDVHRDGMALELMDETEHPYVLVLEVFYADTDGALTLTAHREAVPLELVERVTSQAKLRLPPSNTR
ncbi:MULTISPECIES: hypothetical protein [unclassified Mesorhizobium]|uniref:hypothetical protein n=1 Tax=unclassified Mesorhizobium TaxID=325217 RepID=UPI000FEA80AD|nr:MULTISPECIES: hypothetical protein [unclassified Mesorhizobium]RWC25140.1 MAG: hypothetical protein EOS51_01265 [Mesorhizobium sp.]RWD48760.1 MAG: hypothetical protein EOS35_00520 [Mesorhizobium sp.]TGT95219.1 hypothetical protein EN807_17730 [Mesorhizobium sp. M5C.F.Ca.ET.164.01.1.1]TIS38253.1 MAG: hypothetical protein E5W95_14320 [Mesorhizobium sp.]TIU21690.1 MAG: hypothetical protein E5W53_18090 [Mesorhizobium sp.]